MFSTPRPIRTAFGWLERIAPEVGARWAERIWFTLPPRRADEPADGHRAGAPVTVSLGPTTVVGESWGDGPTVYLVHGWAGQRRQLTAFVAPLVGLGHRVVAFDMPSHGASAPGRFGPRSSTIVEFTDTLTRVVTQHGPARAIVAHSMGATATAGALCDGLHADRVVLVAPMANPLWQLREFAKVLGLGERTVRRLIARVERRVGVPMRHFDVPELGRAVAMPPTLVVHDRGDASTPVSDGAAIAAAWPGARLRVTSGLGHRRILADPDVVTEVVDFITAGR
ncbi:MAG: alpha/beta fold hydrolase [Micromonosporaceae bacterium]